MLYEKVVVHGVAPEVRVMIMAHHCTTVEAWHEIIFSVSPGCQAEDQKNSRYSLIAMALYSG